MTEQSREAWSEALYCMQWHQLTSGQQLIVNASLKHTLAEITAWENTCIVLQQNAVADQSTLATLRKENEVMREALKAEYLDDIKEIAGHMDKLREANRVLRNGITTHADSADMMGQKYAGDSLRKIIKQAETLATSGKGEVG